MKIGIELDENEIRTILADWLNTNFNTNFAPKEVPIQVKSKQNYRSEWEEAAIRVSTELVRKGI